MTLYYVADPRQLGGHRYEEWWAQHDGPDEASRGILYTCRGGFLDLSHIRESVDIAKYTHDRLAEKLALDASGRPAGGVVRFTWADSHYEIRVHTPAWWDTVPADERPGILREAAIRQAQRFIVIVGSWHELGTWYGQETVPPVSEKNSAFTWDDTSSHVVASQVAGRALRSQSGAWNAAVAAELRATLNDLGPVDIDRMAQAVEAVHGRWWLAGVPLRRDLDTGLGTNVKTPWLAPGFEPCAGSGPAALDLPDMSSVLGHDLRDFFDVVIIPPRWMMQKALDCQECPGELHGEADLLAAIERLRAEVLRECGPDGDRP